MNNMTCTLLLLIGIYILYISIKHYDSVSKCEKIIEYRYMPRTLKQEMESPVPISDLFSKMFEKESPRGLNWEDVSEVRRN
jgi:hypothetical protein